MLCNRKPTVTALLPCLESGIDMQGVFPLTMSGSQVTSTLAWVRLSQYYACDGLDGHVSMLAMPKYAATRPAGESNVD